MNQLTNRQSLAQYNVRLYYFATLFGSANFLDAVATLFYFHRGLTASDILVATLCWSGTLLLFEVPTGAFADRYGPKASFLIGCGFSIASQVWVLFAHNLWMFCVYNVLWGLAASFFSGADEALLFDSLKETGEEERMAAVIGKITSATFFTGMITSLLGAFLVRDLSEAQFVLIISLGLVCQVVQLLILLRVKNPRSFEKFRDNPFQHVKNGWRVIRRTPNFIKLFLNFTVIFVPAVVVAGKFEQPYLTGAGVPVQWLGVLYAIVALIGLLLTRNLEALIRRFSRLTLMHLTGWGTLAALLVASRVQSQLGVALAVFFVTRAARSIRYPLFSSMANEYIPSGSRATTLSLLSIGDSLFDLLILSTAAWFATRGLPTIFFGCAVIVLIGLLIPVREAKREAQERAEPVNS